MPCNDLKGDGDLAGTVVRELGEWSKVAGGENNLRVVTVALLLTFAFGRVVPGADMEVVVGLRGEGGREYALTGEGGRIRS